MVFTFSGQSGSFRFSRSIMAFAMTLLLFSPITQAWNENLTVSTILQNQDQIELSISSLSPFLVGSRPYALHVGDAVFTLSQQMDGEGGSTLTFFLKGDEFDNLAQGEKMILVYGLEAGFTEKGLRPAGGKRFHSKHWQLGPLQKEMLNK